ncbi:MAG: translation initiation factor [Bacteroidales bacterium]|nr:translation initiation factor [Bacteroidales bacterium]
MNNDWKDRLGVVYSTNPDFNYQNRDLQEPESTPEPSSQRLTVRIDRKGRAGKQVTLVEGFKGSEDDLKALGRSLKTKLGVGGSISEGDILIQGDFRDRVTTLLQDMGYKARRGN